MDPNGIAIREFYNGYRPPRYAFRTVQKLIRTVPEEYLQGLGCIVLANQSGLPRSRRLGKTTRRKRRYPRSHAIGLYHRADHGEKAWIELYVDKLENGIGRFSWIPLLREMAFGIVLFHEIGHHIHHTVKPEFREKEDIANDWSKRLSKNFFRTEYWYLVPVSKPLGRILKALVHSM